MLLAASNATLLTAFGAGIISFLSPCVLPVVPPYLSLITGLSLADLREPDRRDLVRIAVNTLLFMAGFGVVFVLLFLGAVSLSQTLFDNQQTLERVAGVIVLLMALYLAGSQLLTLPGVYREVRLHPRVERLGPFAAPVAGAAFGLGWSPCIGPILGAVIGIAQTEALRGTSLLVAYTLGLGVPFLAVGLAFGKFARPLGWVRRHARALTLASAAVLAVFGILLLTNQFTVVNNQIQRLAETLHLDWLFQSEV